MGKQLIGWAQVKGLNDEPADPPLNFTWEIPVQLSAEYDTKGEAIIEAIKLGYALGLKAGRGENIYDLPQQKLPNPLLDSIRGAK